MKTLLSPCACGLLAGCGNGKFVKIAKSDFAEIITPPTIYIEHTIPVHGYGDGSAVDGWEECRMATICSLRLNDGTMVTVTLRREP